MIAAVALTVSALLVRELLEACPWTAAPLRTSGQRLQEQTSSDGSHFPASSSEG